MFNVCRAVNTLPYSGGLYDQDWKFVNQMVILLDIYHEKEDIENKKTQNQARRQQQMSQLR